MANRERAPHIILRKRRAATRDVFTGPTVAPADTAGATLTAEVELIDRRDLPSITMRSDVEAVAPVMPLRLIRPRATTVGADGYVSAEGNTWGVEAVGAHTSPFSGDGIVVAVLDTGIDRMHPAFGGVDIQERDFTSEGNGDRDGHGTHCAGTIFGRSIDGTRIGVAPGVRRALIGKVLGKERGGSSEELVDALLWAVDEGAHVVSMSLGIDFPAYVDRLHEGLGLPYPIAVSRGLEAYLATVRMFDKLVAFLSDPTGFRPAVTIVAAAGNESARETNREFEVGVSPPAVAERVVSVGAVGRHGEELTVAPFSNTGPNVCAPGVGILSAWTGGGLAPLDGTSMATPHVAGVAALWAEKLSKKGRLNGLELVQRLTGSADHAGLRTPFDLMDVGAGIVKAPQT